MDLLGNLANLKVDTVLSAVDKYVPGAKQNIKNLADKAKAYVNNVSELELKVLEATNHDPWGPHGSVMQEITNNAFHSEGFYQIMGILDQRLQETAENWRLVYKSLLLLEYMAKHGPLSVADALVSYSRLSHLEKLRDRFEFKEASGRDQGINVRQRAGALVALVQDRDRLAEERDKAAKNKSKYTGVSSGSVRYGGFGPGSTNSSSSFSTSRDYDSYGSSSMGHSSSSGFGGGSSSSTFAGGSGTGYRRSSGSGGDSTAAGAADPVEATRQRIARLKADGALPSAAGGAEGDGAVGPGLESPDSLSPKKPKKLSEIKINPAISAMFAKGGLAPPPSSSSGSKRAGAAAAPAATGIDLLGDLDVPAPAAAPSSSTAKGGLDDWDGFASAAVAPSSAAAGGVTSSAAAAGDDDWAAFDSAPPASSSSQQPKAAIDINSLLGPLPTTTPAAAAAAAGSAAGGASKAPLPLDDFCSLPAAAPTAAPSSAAAAAPGFDPFSSAGPAWGATSSSSSLPAAAAGSADPFAASSAVHMAPQASKQTNGGAAAGPKLGPETAKAKDPFADLALI